MYVPAAGYISPAIDQSPVGLPTMHQPWPWDLVWALSCSFWHCGGSSPCSIPDLASECRVEARPYLRRIGPGAPSRGVRAWGRIQESFSALKGLTVRVKLEECSGFNVRNWIVYICMYLCTCRRPHLARHRSELSRTSNYAPTVARRVSLSPQLSLLTLWWVLSLLDPTYGVRVVPRRSQTLPQQDRARSTLARRSSLELDLEIL